MSLLGSIFGSGKEESEKEKKGLSTLFEKSSALPDKPQHKVQPKPVRPKKQEIEKQKEEQNPKKKRKLERKEASKKNLDGVDGVAASKNADKGSSSSADNKDGTNQEGETTENSKDANERTVFVGNLPLSTTRKSLAALFRSCGKIDTTRLRSVAAAGVKLPPDRAGDQNLVKRVCANTNKIEDDVKTTAQGYVVFASAESVENALKLNNTIVSKKENLRMRVDHSVTTQDPTRSIFVGNLPYRADEASLRQHFVKGCGLDKEGNVENVRIVRDKETMQCKGFGYILFEDKNMVATALNRMHESVYMKRTLRVMVCGKRYKGRRGAEKPESAGGSRMNQRSFEGKRATAAEPTMGAAKRILGKQKAGPEKKRRARGETNKKAIPPKGGIHKAGVSRRAAVEAKVDKRVKKLEKRAKQGMGKARH